MNMNLEPKTRGPRLDRLRRLVRLSAHLGVRPGLRQRAALLREILQWLSPGKVSLPRRP